MPKSVAYLIMCVLFLLFYSVTVDSFWQFKMNSFLGCAQDGRREEEAAWISSVHLTRLAGQRWGVHLYICTVPVVPGQCHMASCLSQQKTAQFDWYLLCLDSGRATGSPVMVTQWTLAPGGGRGHTTQLTTTIKWDQISMNNQIFIVTKNNFKTSKSYT